MELQKTRVRIENCSKTFKDGTAAVENVNIDISGGETIVFLGPSGCGKTTTLRLIAGLELADPGGKIYFDDEDVTDLPIEMRNVGMVFQSYALFPNMNVEKNISYGLKVKKLAPSLIKSRTDEMLELMHLSDFRTKMISQLSGGQRQRVALARAIAPQPRILLLDEPLAALDALLREKLRLDLSQLLKMLGITSIYVTHDREEGMALGDRLVIMSKGRVDQIGTAQEVYEKPANRHVARFIGNLNNLEIEVQGDYFLLQGKKVKIPPHKTFSGKRVFYRPEHVQLCETGQSQIEGRVEHTYFFGSYQRLSISGIGPKTIIVDNHTQKVYTQGDKVGIVLAIDKFMDLST